MDAVRLYRRSRHMGLIGFAIRSLRAYPFPVGCRSLHNASPPSITSALPDDVEVYLVLDGFGERLG